MSTDTIDSIVAEVIAKRPELAPDREAVKDSILLMEGLGELLLEQIPEMRDEYRAALKSADLNVAVAEEAKREFGIWGIDPVKLAKFFGGETEVDACKVVQLSLIQEPDSCTWKEALKTFVLARLNPEFDVLVQ